MTGQAHDPLDLLRRRVGLVADVSALNARVHKLIQAISGIEMEVLRLELEIGRSEADAELVQELHETEERAAAMRTAQAECLEEIAAAEAEVAELDRLLASERAR